MHVITCRNCGKALTYERMQDLPWFPFCSEKCKLLDLGGWFDGTHRISTDEPAEDAPSEAQ